MCIVSCFIGVFGFEAVVFLSLGLNVEFSLLCELEFIAFYLALYLVHLLTFFR